MSWAKVGAKCVCIDASGRDGVWLDGEAPIEGNTYTVRRAFVDSSGNFVIDFLELKRATNSILWLGYDTGYFVDRFRPIVTRSIEQDVQMFKRIAETAPSLEDAE